MGWLGGTRGSFQGDVRGGYFAEDRGNGTPAQVNATITRWGGGERARPGRGRRVGRARRRAA